MSSIIFTFPPLCPLPLTKGGDFQPLHKEGNDFKVFQESVSDFDAIAYLRGNPKWISSFFCGSGRRTMSSIIFTFPPLYPLPLTKGGDF